MWTYRWLALGCGVAATASALLAEAPMVIASPISDWGSQVDGPANQIEDAITRLYSQMNSNNLNGAKAECRQLQSSAQRLQAALPSPNPVLTSEVGLGVSALLAGSKDCLAAGSGVNKGQINTVKKNLDIGMMHLQKAQSIVAAG